MVRFSGIASSSSTSTSTSAASAGAASSSRRGGNWRYDRVAQVDGEDEVDDDDAADGELDEEMSETFGLSKIESGVTCVYSLSFL